MENTNTPPVTAPGQTNASSDTGAAKATEQVTAEQLAAIEQRMEEKTRGLYAEIKRLRNESKPAEKPPEEGSTKEELIKLRDEYRQDKVAAEQERIDADIHSAISAHGIDPDNAEILEAYIDKKFRANMKVEKKKTIYVDPTTAEQLSASDIVANVLKSSKGDKFRPAIPTSSARGLKPGSAIPAPTSYQAMPQEERLKLTPAEAMAMISAEMQGRK